MKIRKKYIMGINNIRGVIIITRPNSSYDRNIFQHPDWFIPVYECNYREVIENMKKYPDYTIIKQRAK